MRRIFPTLPAILLFIGLAFPATWHVATNGDDKAAGTVDAPFRSIQRGAEAAMPGDTVLVREGVYRERVAPPRGGEPGKPISFQAEPGKNVIVKGSDLWAPAWEKDGALHAARPDDALFNDDCYVDDRNPFKVELSTTPFGREGKREVERKFGGDARLVFTLGQIWVNGETYRQVPLKEEASEQPKSWWVDAATGKIFIHFLGNPDEKTIEISTRRRVFAPHKRGLGYLEVRGFILEHAAGQYPCNFWEKGTPQWQQAGLLGTRSGHHWVIQSNVIRQGMVGLDFGYESVASQDRGDLERGDNGKAATQVGWHLIEANRICDNLGPGTASMAAVAIRFIGNVVERNNRMGFTGKKRFETAGIKMHTPAGSLIAGNLVRSNLDCPGIWIDGGSGTNTSVTGNLVIGNAKGFDLEIGSFPEASCVLAFNVFLDNDSAGVSSRESGGLLVMNNLVSGPGYGYRVQADVKREGRWSSAHQWCFGNLFLGSTTLVQVQSPSFAGRGDLFGDRRFDFNLYGVKPGDARFSILDLPERLTFPDWKDAWKKRLGDKYSDQHGAAAPVSVGFDAEKLTLDLGLLTAPPVSDFRHARATRDYDGKALPAKFPAGPFPSLSRGSNEFELWRGIAPLSEYALPWGGSERVGPEEIDPLSVFDPASNLLVNGDFRQNTNGWAFTTTEGAMGMAVFQEAAVRLIVDADGPKEWSVQLKQNRIPLGKGVYELSFEARADAPRSLKAEIIQDAMPQRPFLRQTASLTTAWTPFRYTFNVGNPERNARLHFRLGTLGLTALELRAVALRRIR